MRIRLTAAELREIVPEQITISIDSHRASRSVIEADYRTPSGPPTEQEVTDFINSNQLLDNETIEFLTNPGFLDFEVRINSYRAEWFVEFRSNVIDWTETETWLGADMIEVQELIKPEPAMTKIWYPTSSKTQPNWIEKSPTALMITADLLKSDRLLSELNWREFKKFIVTLLEKAGWLVELTKDTKDGGVDVIATTKDPNVGLIKSLWQAKKYHPKNKVQLRQVRELSAIRGDQKATKAIIVTTSYLTRGAIDWIRRDEFRLDYKDKNDMEKWVLDLI